MSRFIGNVSAYAYAVSKGYTGTEEEFAELMASYAEVGQTAVDAAESALNSKTAAQTAATTATNKAGEATTAAQTATTKAGEAQTSAQTASTKASEAVGCVETATQKATEASQSASQALGYKTDAESAKTASQTAQGLAESARDSAISAKNDAESARDDAQEIVDGINAKSTQIDANTASIASLTKDKAPVITDTALGSIASFSDGADGLPLKSLVVNINPVQSGSGDPSPDNVRPISGWSEVNVQRTGKNLFDADSFPFTAGYVSSTDGRLSNDGTSISKTAGYIPCGHLAGQTITINHRPGSGFSPGVAFYDADKEFISGVANASSSSTEAWSMTVPATAEFMRITVPYEQAGVQIELGSTATPYEPYSGQSITINLGQTVYGGTLDVLTGVLTVDRYFIDPSQWTQYGASNGYKAYNNLNIPKALGQLNIVNKPLSNMISEFGSFSSSSMNKNIIQPPFPTQTIPKAYMALEDDIDPTSVEFSYIVQTPIVIQLTPNQVNSLLGVNNIWADSGDTTAEYRADTKLFIERLTAPDSADMIADANITSGQYFMVGNSLYKATANIANGSAIIVGTNCTRKSLSEALNEINA